MQYLPVVMSQSSRKVRSHRGRRSRHLQTAPHVQKRIPDCSPLYHPLTRKLIPERVNILPIQLNPIVIATAPSHQITGNTGNQVHLATAEEHDKKKYSPKYPLPCCCHIPMTLCQYAAKHVPVHGRTNYPPSLFWLPRKFQSMKQGRVSIHGATSSSPPLTHLVDAPPSYALGGFSMVQPTSATAVSPHHMAAGLEVARGQQPTSCRLPVTSYLPPRPPPPSCKTTRHLCMYQDTLLGRFGVDMASLRRRRYHVST